MNNFYYRSLQSLPYQIPGAFRGVILEDSNGDFNIYINTDLCDERKLKTIIHERMHAFRGDTSTKDLASEIERYLSCELELSDLAPVKPMRTRSEHPGETVEEFEDRMFLEHGISLNISNFARSNDLPQIEDAILDFVETSLA